MAKNKPNPLLAKFEERLQADYRRRLRIQEQLLADSAYIALNEEFGFGAERLERFSKRWLDIEHEILILTRNDGTDDPECVYAKAKLDQRLHQIFGDDLVAFDERYR